MKIESRWRPSLPARTTVHARPHRRRRILVPVPPAGRPLEPAGAGLARQRSAGHGEMADTSTPLCHQPQLTSAPTPAAVSTPVRDPLQLKSAPTPVFDSPSSPEDAAPLTPTAKTGPKNATSATADGLNPATPKAHTAPPGRKLFTSPDGKCPVPKEQIVLDDSPVQDEVQAKPRASFAAADDRHQRRLQIREALCTINDSIACLERAAWLHGLALKCGQQEDWGVSLDAVDEAVLELQDSKLDQQLPKTVEELMLLRAGVLLKLECFDAAAKTCSAMIERNPEHAEALSRRGLSEAFQGKYEEARADLACAASLLPSPHPVHQAVLDVDEILESRKQEVQMHATFSPRQVYP